MWGNRIGWCISIVIIGATVGMLYLLSQANDTTPSTPFAAEAARLSPLQMPIDPRSLLRVEQSPTDAGPFYRHAIEAYIQDPAPYDGLAGASAVDAQHLADAAALEDLLKAAGCQQMSLFAAKPAEVITYDAEKPSLEALRSLGIAALHVGTALAKQDKLDDAMRYTQAAFALGAHLYDERLDYAEMSTGLDLLSSGTDGLIALAHQSGDAAYAGQLQDFTRARAKYVADQILPTERIIGSIDPAVMTEHAGDVMTFAQSSKERLWRVEAILKLGRSRFWSARRGDQLAAERELSAFANESDPVIRTAARVALDLTVEQYRTLR